MFRLLASESDSLLTGFNARKLHPLKKPLFISGASSQDVVIVNISQIWWPVLGLNQRPLDYESIALTN